jgi:hypothetical protein
LVAALPVILSDVLSNWDLTSSAILPPRVCVRGVWCVHDVCVCACMCGRVVHPVHRYHLPDYVVSCRSTT